MSAAEASGGSPSSDAPAAEVLPPAEEERWERWATPTPVREVHLRAGFWTLALMEPEPLVIVEGFGDSAVNLRFAVWTTKDNYLNLRNGIQEEVKARFDREGIEIPFPHRTLYVGAYSEPFPVRVVVPSSPAPEGSEGRSPQPEGSEP